ncbi:MAG: diacylglycerol kinase [Endozoicomonadaceae bacterium]|nr:diacylglycerol kinase [Endozoicomonadaceae bacterium]
MKKQSKPNGSGFMRIINAFKCSMLGFKAAFTHESAFRQELLLCVVLLPFSFIIASTSFEWIMLICSLLFLLFSEIINSAIEALADKISLEHHELLGRAKDLGSAGVFIAILINITVWSQVTYSHFF